MPPSVSQWGFTRPAERVVSINLLSYSALLCEYINCMSVCVCTSFVAVIWMGCWFVLFGYDFDLAVAYDQLQPAGFFVVCFPY